MVTYITAQYRHVVVCSGLYPVRSQSLHGGYSSGCIESAMQPSFTEKSSRTTLHYVIRNDSARDLVLPPWVLQQQKGWDRGRWVGAPGGCKQHGRVWAPR